MEDKFRMRSCVVSSLEELFQSYNIYKSVVVVRPGYVKSCYKTLERLDYPVATLDALDRFVLGNARVLLMDDRDATQLQGALRGVEHVLDQVSMVVCLGSKRVSTRYMRHLPHFFI